MGRKTISVEELRLRVNHMLLHSEDNYRQGREALITMLTSILHDTGNYEGFNYLNFRDMITSQNGTTVGINYDWDKKIPMEDVNKRFENTDSTRALFY